MAAASRVRDMLEPLVTGLGCGAACHGQGVPETCGNCREGCRASRHGSPCSARPGYLPPMNAQPGRGAPVADPDMMSTFDVPGGLSSNVAIPAAVWSATGGVTQFAMAS